MSRVMENPIVANSLSYCDLLGVLAGLDRLPGECSDQFVDRIRQAGADMLNRTKCSITSNNIHSAVAPATRSAPNLTRGAPR